MSVKTLTQRLEVILGKEGVKRGSSALEPFLDAANRDTELIRVLPRDNFDLEDVMGLAKEEGLNVFSVRSRYLPPGLEKEMGLLVDPARMDQVKNLDSRNLMASIGAGVTFEQINPLLEEAGMRLLQPACATSPYVLRSYLDRDILVGSVCYRHTQLSIFHAVLADGRLWVSGSNQMSEEGHADFREDQGPQLSLFFGASEDIYGIPVYGIVYTYPIREKRQVMAFGFKELSGALDFSHKVSREDHCFELVGGDSLFWAVLTEKGKEKMEALRDQLPPWTVLVSIEHRAPLVELQSRMVREDARSLGGEILGEGVTARLGSNLGRPWYLWERSRWLGGIKRVFYYTFSHKASAQFQLAAEKASALGGVQVAQYFVPAFYGGSFFCQSDLHYSPDEEEKAEKAWGGTYETLLDQGVLVDKPTGELARMVFSRAKPSYLEMIKRLKRILDPEGRLNPGQLLEGI